MSKKLKSFHKLFFIIIFSIIFLGAIGSGNSPDLPEKIAPELEQIEALPRRTKPAELNIEVTKIKSEPLEDVYIDRKNKNIYVDFSKKREQTLRGVKDAEELEKKYNLIVSETIQGTNEVNGRKKSSRNTSSVMDYEVVEYQGKKVLKIPYENEPEKFYISIQESGNEKLVKVYNINMENIQVVNSKGAVIEEKIVVVNLQGGIENWRNTKFVFNLDGTLTYNSTGAAGDKTENIDLNKVQIIKSAGFNSTNDGFINSFRQNVDIKATSLGAKDPNPKILYKGDQNSSEAQFYYVQKPDNTGNGQDGIEIKYLTDGNLIFRFQQIDSVGKVTYTINIEHIEKNTENIKKHTLIINTNQNMSLKERFSYVNPENKILIKESEVKNDFNNDGTAKYPEKIYKFYSQEEIGMKLNKQLENLNLFPVIYLGEEKNNGNYRIQNQKLPYRVQIKGGGTGIITLMPNLVTSDFSYEHTVAAGSALEKPASDTFYNAVGGGVVNPTKNAIYTKILFYITGKNLEKLLIKSRESSDQIVQLSYSENYTYSLSPANYLNFGNNCYLPSESISLDDILESQLPPIEIEKSQESLNYKTLERKIQLNDLIISDDEEVKNEYVLGYLENKQIGNYVEQGRPFPVIALGSQMEINNSGWGWSSINNPNDSWRESVVSEFKNPIGNLSVELYFKNIVSNPLKGKIERGRNERINMIGSYLEGYAEQVGAYLYGSFQNIPAIKEMLIKARENDLREVVFKSEDLEQINFVMGQFLYVAEWWGRYYYTIPALGNLTNSGEEKIYKYNYPNIKIRKELIEDNLTLNLKEGFNIENLIKFSKDGVTQEDITLETSKNLYLKSLNYLSYITFNNNDFLEIDSNGNTKEEVVMLKDISTNNQLKLSIKYELGYPILKVNDYDGKGEYILSIKHYDPSSPTKLKRRNYILKIIIEEDKKLSKFKINKNINEIIIRKEKENYIVEYPENKINMIQQTKDSKLFPVIALNSKDKWEINTTSPFNLTDKRPWSSFDIGENIKVSTSLKETPYQNKEKFFIYNRGELSNRNIAAGGYNDKELEGDKNKVEIDFKIDFSQEILEKFWAYSQNFSENKVLIPYSSNEVHKIYALKGERNIEGFKINSTNILEEIDFPKVYVLKDDDIRENESTITFKNPVPKSDLNLKGSFDINSNGLKLPNNMPYTLEHPESLNISGITPEWQGYSKINEYHEIDIKVLRNGVTNFIKTITTNIDGTLKDNIEIKNEEKYSYVLKKGKNSLVAIGLETWDLNRTIQYEETLILEHKNSSGRVTHRDKYKVVIQPFNILTYLALPNPISPDKKLVKSIETETQRVPLIDFQLKNYDKEITKSTSDSIGVKISINDQEIELSSSGSNPLIIKGTLSFVGDKSSLQNPNELGNLVFNVTSGTIQAGITYSYRETTPLVTIKTSNLIENIIEKFEVTGTNIGTDLSFPYFNAKSNLKEIVINDNINISDTGLDLSMGKISLQQNGTVPNQGSDMQVFPAIALGKRKNLGWEVQGEPINNIDKRELVFTKYSFEKNPTSEIFLRTFISGYINSSNTYTYKKSDKEDKIIIVGSYKWGDLQEKIESEIKLTLSKVMLEKAREISGNRIVLKANTDVDNKIALIHSQKSNSNPTYGYFYLPTNNTKVLNSDRIRYFNYKNIIIEKDSFTKNLKLKFLKTYIGNTKIKFGKDSIITSDLSTKGVELSFYEKGTLYGLEFKNKIKISSLDETIIQGQTEYDIDAQGKLVTPIEIKMIKNGAEAILNLDYDNLDALLSLKDTKLEEEFNIALDYIEPSGDIRRKYNLSLATSGENIDVNYKKGEIDLIISSRYNPIDGQLNSEPILITKDGVKYQTEVLDLKLLNGDYPIELKENQKAYINGKEILLNESYTTVTLNKGTIIKAKRESNGDLKLKPIYWNYNTEDEFILEYKKESIVTNQYKFNVKCPEFFVASSGVLDFGKLYQFGNPQDKIVTTNIELNYNTNVNAEYFLDISQEELNTGTDIFKNYLYLDDNKTLLVKDLFLGEEEGKETTKRTLPLTGTIHGPSVLKASEGKYEKTIQILIHLK